MYRYYFLIFIFFSFYLNGATFKDDKYLQIVAQKLEVKDSVVKANGNVVVYSPNYYITANKLVYDKKSSVLELFDDVNIIKNGQFTSFSQYSFLDMKNERNTIKPFLLLDNTSKLWFNSTNTNQTKDQYTLEDATISSCDCADPSWSISFSSGDYNTSKQWINTYNTTLYVKDVPVFYTPYFGFPTDKTRRTGLLKPKIGYSSDEGFFYAQPIYYAPQANYDMEYIPQIRAKRGKGHAFKYRYTDSKYSLLKFETAIFKEDKQFQEDNSLENEKHYGWNLEYKRSKLISDGDDSDGFVLKSLDMNDVDYINTKYDSDTNNYTNKFLESQIKYYYNSNKYYGDVDIRLYNDISKDNNDDVMQTLPSINLHKFSDNIIADGLSYSTNLQVINKTRDIGLGARTTTLNLPISYYFSLFDDYINIQLTEQVNFNNIEYTNNSSGFKNVNYGENNHILSIYTDLVRPYDSFLHAFKLNTTYTYNNTYLEEGDIYGINSNDSQLSTFGITNTQRNISVGIDQSFYKKDTLKETVKHNLKQLYTYNKEIGKFEKGDLENELVFNHDYGSIENRLTYNHDIKRVTKSNSTLKLKHKNIFFNGYYNTKRDTVTLKNEETAIYDFGLKFNKYYQASYKEEYDVTNSEAKKKEYIFNIDKKCWATQFKFVDSLVATNTTNDSVLRQNILYLEVKFKQLFTLDQVHKFKERNQ